MPQIAKKGSIQEPLSVLLQRNQFPEHNWLHKPTLCLILTIDSQNRHTHLVLEKCRSSATENLAPREIPTQIFSPMSITTLTVQSPITFTTMETPRITTLTGAQSRDRPLATYSNLTHSGEDSYLLSSTHSADLARTHSPFEDIRCRVVFKRIIGSLNQHTKTRPNGVSNQRERARAQPITWPNGSPSQAQPPANDDTSPHTDWAGPSPDTRVILPNFLSLQSDSQNPRTPQPVHTTDTTGPSPHAVSIQKKKKKQIPTRRSQRIQARQQKNHINTDPLPTARSKITKIPFNLDDSMNFLDADVALSLLQATGLLITDQVKQMIEQAVSQDALKVQEEQLASSTPLHDPIPPLIIPGTDIVL